MAPTTEEQPKRVYCFKMHESDVLVRIAAERLCRPSKNDPTYRLKVDDNLVGELRSANVDAWWIEEGTTPNLVL